MSVVYLCFCVWFELEELIRLLWWNALEPDETQTNGWEREIAFVRTLSMNMNYNLIMMSQHQICE